MRDVAHIYDRAQRNLYAELRQTREERREQANWQSAHDVNFSQPAHDARMIARAASTSVARAQSGGTSDGIFSISRKKASQINSLWCWLWAPSPSGKPPTTPVDLTNRVHRRPGCQRNADRPATSARGRRSSSTRAEARDFDPNRCYTARAGLRAVAAPPSSCGCTGTAAACPRAGRPRFARTRGSTRRAMYSIRALPCSTGSPGNCAQKCTSTISGTSRRSRVSSATA